MTESVTGIKKTKHVNKRRNFYAYLESQSPESMIGHSLRAELTVIPEEITLIPNDFNEVFLKLKENGVRNEKVICIFNNPCVLLLIISCETDNLPTNAAKSFSSEQFENDVDKIEISESDLAILNDYFIEKSTDTEKRDAEVDEVLLKYFAMAIAKSLKHPEICQTLKNKIGEKFDGDYDALWEHIKNKRISGRDLRVLVESRFSERTRKLLPITKIEEIPLLQVSLPVNFDDWDGESAILVAYTPLTSDDMVWEEINAYDADLKEYILDAKTEPDFPVMVVGLNERVDPVTQKLYLNQYRESISKPSPDDSPEPTTYTDVILDYVYLYDDGEPWVSGSPEIYWLFGNTAMGTYRHNAFSEWTGWGTNRSWHHVHNVLFIWYLEYGELFLINFMEEDGGGNVTFTAGYGPISISYTINSRDDNLGSHPFNKNDPVKTKEDPYSTGSVRFVIDWFEYTK